MPKANGFCKLNATDLRVEWQTQKSVRIDGGVRHFGGATNVVNQKGHALGVAAHKTHRTHTNKQNTIQSEKQNHKLRLHEIKTQSKRRDAHCLISHKQSTDGFLSAPSHQHPFISLHSYPPICSLAQVHPPPPTKRTAAPRAGRIGMRVSRPPRAPAAWPCGNGRAV